MSDGPESVDRQTETLSRISEGVVALDRDLRYTFANDRALELLDVPESDLLGERIHEVFPEVAESESKGNIERAMETGETVTYERFNEEFDEWFEITIYPDDEGVTLLFGTITERKKYERRIEELHEATRGLLAADSKQEVAEQVCATGAELLDLSANGVHFYDEAADALVPAAVSEASREMLGDPPTLDEGLAWAAYQAGETRVVDDVRDAPERFNPDTTMRSELFVPLGEYGICIYSSTEVGTFDQDDVRLAEVLANNAETALDTVEKERRLQEGRRELHRADTLFQNAQDAFFVVDVEADGYRIQRVNPAYQTLTGLDRDALEGRTITEIFRAADAEAISEQYDECVRTKSPLSYVEELAVPEPNSYWDTRIAPVIIGDEVVQIVGATRNVTEQKAYERQLEEQRNNLELLNRMVRHDIRNDLQVISSSAELLKGRVDDEEREYVERILDNTRNAVDLTRSARELAGTMLREDERTQPMPLADVLRSQLDEIRSTYPDALVTVDDKLPTVDVVADDMLPSVFRNVIKNAIQHNDKAVAEVRIGVSTTPETVRVSVADNGPGIPDDQKSVVFGKGEKGLESEGTGIGLYLVNTLVDRYGGETEVTDNDPTGTVIEVTLQRVAAA